MYPLGMRVTSNTIPLTTLALNVLGLPAAPNGLAIVTMALALQTLT